MLPVIRPQDIEKNKYQVVCLRFPCKQIIDKKNYSHLPLSLTFVIDLINKRDDINPGTIKLFKTNDRCVIGIFCQKFYGPPSEGDEIFNRMVWLSLAVSKFSKVKNMKSVVFIDTHIQDELTDLYCTLLKMWGMTCGIPILITSEDELIMDNLSDVSKAKLFDEAYFDPLLHIKLRSFIKNKTKICNCQTKFIPEGNELMCKKCIKNPIDITNLTWANATFETLVFNISPEWGWSKFFSDNMIMIKDISKQLAEEPPSLIMPQLCNVLEAFRLCRPQDIKVVIIGQDPYYIEGVATGLAFSAKGTTPKSLANIFKELNDDGFSSNTSSLTSWAKQGVFLINTFLTVKVGVPNSHKEIWKNFPKKLFSYLNEMPLPLVVVMWGKEAQSYSSCFSDRHKKITSSHPSPMSVSYGFAGSRPFSKINKFLEELEQKQINWNL